MSARNEKTGDAEIIEMPLGEKPVPAADAASAPAAPRKRNGRRIVIMAAVPVVLAAVGGYFWLTGGRYQETDNAYVEQAKVAVSADVAGRIASVSVHENQSVRAGDVLFSIDPEPYRIALAQADAALATSSSRSPTAPRRRSSMRRSRPSPSGRRRSTARMRWSRTAPPPTRRSTM